MSNIEKTGDKVPENGLMLSEIARVLYTEKDVLEEAEGSGNRSRKLGAAGLAIITVLSCVGTNKAEAKGGFNFGQILNQSAQQGADNFIRESFDAIRERRQGKQRMEEETIRKMQNMQEEEVRRRQNMDSDAVRTKLQLDEQRVRNFNDEIRAAKTDDEVAFIKRKYGMAGR